MTAHRCEPCGREVGGRASATLHELVRHDGAHTCSALPGPVRQFLRALVGIGRTPCDCWGRCKCA